MALNRTQADPAVARELDKPQWQEEWWLRYGWNRNGGVPPYLASAKTGVSPACCMWGKTLSPVSV